MSTRTSDKVGGTRLVPLIRLLARLPLPLLYLIADALFVLLYGVLGYQRKLVLDNLRGVFTLTPEAELRRLARATYRNALDVLFETLRALRMRRDELLARVSIENPEEIERHLRQGRTVVTVAAHHGNWEWLQLVCAARFDWPIDALYKPLNRPSLDRLIQHLRSRFGTRLIAVNTALRALLERRSTVRIIALVADQGPRPDEDKVWYRFLGRDTAFYPGLEKITRITDAPLVFAHMQRCARGRYRIRFETLAETPGSVPDGELMARYLRAVEQQIRRAPADWLWLYKRWKYRRPAYD